MTVRYRIACSICEQNYLMRISLGHTEKQEHIVECNNCKSSMHIEVILDNPPNYEINCLENCQEAAFEDEGLFSENENYITKNLHPELLIPKEFSESNFYNTNVFEGIRLAEERMENVGSLSNQNMKMTYEYTSNLKIIEKNWNILKVAWKMKNNKQSDKIIVKHLKKYKSLTESETSDFESILFDFNNTILFPDFIDNTPEFSKFLQDSFDKSESKNKEYLECIKYYKENLLDENMKKFYDIYYEFFELYNDFKSLLMYVVTSQDINYESIVSSENFEKTKMFYGKLFEAYTSNVSFITMLHNVYKGRKFDKLENIDFQNYLSTDKAKRTINFKNTEEFSFFDEFIDSKLRNASHHGNIELKDGIVIYKSGKPLKEYTMTYTKYLETCTQLFIRFIILHQLQILKYRSYLKYNR